jgi:hypothetical protein
MRQIGQENPKAETQDEASRADGSKEFSDFSLPECDLKKSIYEAEKLYNASNFKVTFRQFNIVKE